MAYCIVIFCVVWFFLCSMKFSFFVWNLTSCMVSSRVVHHFCCYISFCLDSHSFFFLFIILFCIGCFVLCIIVLVDFSTFYLLCGFWHCSVTVYILFFFANFLLPFGCLLFHDHVCHFSNLFLSRVLIHVFLSCISLFSYAMLFTYCVELFCFVAFCKNHVFHVLYLFNRLPLYHKLFSLVHGPFSLFSRLHFFCRCS